MMKIACLGWGSLIWKPGGLPIRGRWLDDGPILPVEFARESSGRRITLVITPAAQPVVVLWCLLDCDALDVAKRVLADRECVDLTEHPNYIGVWPDATANSPTHRAIGSWATTKGLDAVVWTDLPPGMKKTRWRVPNAEEVVTHLRTLVGAEQKEAREYIERAPAQVDTEYRCRIRAELGWSVPAAAPAAERPTTVSTTVQAPVAWFMRIRQGRGGRDFTQQVWETGHVGIMFGCWPIAAVLDSANAIAEDKLTLSWLAKDCPDPTSWLTTRHLALIRRFLLELKPGHPVVVHFSGTYHVGTLKDGFGPDITADDGERIKCRPIGDVRTYRVEELPAVFRLLRMTGQATIQRIISFAPQVRFLIDYRTPKQIRSALTAMPTADFLSMLSDSQWERLCEEYLRDRCGFRSLLIAPGKTLPDVDLVGVDRDGRRVLAQCKNATFPVAMSSVSKWAEGLGDAAARPFFFNRGGFSGEDAGVAPPHIASDEITRWLEGTGDYATAVRVL